MRKVAIISSTAPAKPRSEKYPVGASVTRTSGGSTIIQGGSEGVDIVKKDDIKSLTDKNVMSSLRVLAEFISKKDDSEVTAIIDYLKGLKIDGNLINRLLLQNTATEEVKDTDVMSALRVLAEITANNEELKKIFLRKDEIDSTNYLLGLLGGAVVENGLIVRLPKQNTPAALMSCLLEEDEDTLIEEDEDAIVEVAPAEASGDLTLGGLINVDPSFDTLPNDVYSLEMRDGIFYPQKRTAITFPIESEFGDSLFKAISQKFFTDEIERLNSEIEDAKNQDINLLTFDVEDGCLMMNQPSDNSNVDFSISEGGNLLFDIKV